ncbi:insulinase family protein [Sabulilitoribacter arenilitoris]|uniref:Insulinase family protein n=1 Tax=Wocania arenilitoris TaxID=2044858 RepID=A0AAE3EQE4_9FLAO|nr:M16 family metallopeptidase [Wocania arenilitoris]MCF7568274.1 insulinase family protein [Wocania arenilitoris]
MKRILFQLFAIAFCLNTSAQSLNLSQSLPEDQSIRKGVLSNGMTYYLHSTDVTKDVASYYIIQNVGSILENDNQQGLAHFLEHMAFNGTKAFPGKGILETLQKEGIVFGKDINAYTSFDETVYNVDNVPTRPELIETGLQILHDWSNYLLLTEEEIDAERGVIKEEWRTRQNGGMRILQKNIGAMVNNSKYANRLPIGLMDIVENFEYKALRDFYHDWYRTDLQAIAVIGDFDIDEMETKIKAKFSSIPAVKDGPERFSVKIDDNEDMIYAIAMDKEVATSNISFSIRHPKSLENETIGDLKENLLNNMVNSILSTRFQEISQQPNAPFMGVRAGYSDDGFARNHKSFALGVYPKPNMQQEAFKLAITEVNRAVKFGFTNAEINRVKAEFGNYYENQISKLDDRSHRAIVRTIQKNYLKNASMKDVKAEYELVKIFFSQLTQADLLVQIKKMYTQKNRSLIVTGVDGNNNLTKADALAIIKAAENDTTLKPYEEEEEAKELMSGVTLTSGKIVSEVKNQVIGSTEFTLSNGVKVHYKFVNKNKNKVSLQAISDGGMSLVSNEDLPSANLLGQVIEMSGLGEFSATELPKVLAGKTARASTRINGITESVSGSSSTKDVKTMLQLVNLRFTKPRFDKDGYNVFMQNVDNFLIRKSKQVSSKMNDSITTILYGKNHPKERLFDKNYVSEASFDKMKSIYKTRFANVADFTFFIIGDVSKEDLKPLLENYIASIPANDIKENWKDTSSSWINKTTDKDVYLEMEDPKTSVRLSVKNDMEYSLKNMYLMRTLGDILQLRYTESLREQEGGTYGASSRGSLSKEPKEQARLSVSFDCNPDLAEKLISIVHNEMEAIKNGTIQQKDLDKTLANYLKEREESQNYNGYEMSLLMNYVLEGYNMNDPKNFEDIIKSITATDIQRVMGTLLKDAESYEIVFKPKK